MKVIITSHAPSEDQLKEQHAVVVHGLYAAAKTIIDQQWAALLKDVGAQVVYQSEAARKTQVDAVYQMLLAAPRRKKRNTRKPSLNGR